MPLLEVTDLDKTFTVDNRSVTAIDRLSLSIDQHEFVSIVGPSGCGKSTFLHILGGFEPASGGDLRLNGRPIGPPGPDRGMMFQELSLFPWLTAIENVAWPLEMKGLPKRERLPKAAEYLDLVHLARFADLYPGQLSGGMKQRVALARLFALDPEIMLMDEPFGALDSQTRELLQEELQSIWGRVWTALVTEVANGVLVYHGSVTISRALTGFLLAALVGIPFAAAMARSVLVRNLFEPIFFIGYPVPKIALFPVFTYIFGIGTPSKIAFTFIECLYPIVVACYFGFRAVQTRLVWSAQNCGAGRATILSRVILPAALPSIFSGLRVALPVAIIVVVITEMIGDSIGLGYYITIWSTRFTFANVYAAIIVIGICGLALDQALLLLRRRAVYWEREGS